MSSTGTRPVRTVQSRSNEALIEADKELINSLKIFSEASNFVAGLTGSPAQNSPKTPAGNYLAREGDSMIGPLALGPPLDFSIDVDANNTIDIGPLSDNAQFTSNVQLDDLQPNSSVLDIIANAAFDGQILVLRTFAPTTPYTISQGTLANGGNIQTGDGNDLTVGDLQTVTLIFDESLKIEANTGGSWRVLSVSSGTGGLSEPVILTINTITPQTLPTTSVIDWSKNPNQITLDRDVEFSFSNLPASGSYEGVLVIIDVDATGGFATPVWPASLTNPPIVPTTALTRTSVMLYTIDGGTIVTHATSVGSSSGGTTALSQLTIDTNKDWLAQGISNLGALTGVTATQYVDTGSVVRGSISGDAGAAALRIATAVSGKLIISDVITDIAEFTDTTGLTMLGTHVINMGNNIINTISELQFSNTNLHTPSNGLTIAFDSGVGALRYSVPLTTNVHQFFADTDLLASFSRVGANEGLLTIESVVANILQTDDQLFFTDSSTDPTVNGQFRRNGADVKVFTGSSLVNLSDVGLPQSAIVDGNTSATVLDAAPSFVVVLDGVQKYSISNTRVDFVDLDLFGINQINMTDPASNPISSLTASASGLLLNIISTSDVYDIKFNSVDAFHVDNLRTRVLSTSTNLLPAQLSLFRDDASPTNDDALGLIKFDGRDSAGNFTTYAELRTTIENVTDGVEAANFFIKLKQNNFDVDMFRLVDGAMILRTFTSVGGDGANFTLLKEDATPIAGELVGNINWNVLDTPTELTYARIQTFIQEATDAALFKIQLRSDNTLQDALIIEGNDNNTQFQYLTSSNGNTRMQPGSTTVMGYFVTPQVTDFTLNIGTAGSLQIPRLADNSPTLTALNQAFGAFDGAFGYESVDERLYVRESSTRWVFFSAAGAVT